MCTVAAGGGGVVLMPLSLLLNGMNPHEGKRKA